ncbi:hypothetical protein B296_00033397 [Ensete ventricosum]|uniref:Uncharacterized protein n=1 Tax=Ensete ventricosum TaxID=4639 RepID=A0A426YE49_ENSVE|nr:hypothetical protein B296_00033397 [Ensete ventricosum]
MPLNFLNARSFARKEQRVYPNLESPNLKPLIILVAPGIVPIAYYLLHSLVEHSCINPKSLAFGSLDEKSIDIGLMKFLGLCPSTLSWYLEFAFAFSTSSVPLQSMLSLHESKGSMTPRKSHLYGSMPLYADDQDFHLMQASMRTYGRPASAVPWHSPLESTTLLVIALFTEVELSVAPDHSHDHVPLLGTLWYLHLDFFLDGIQPPYADD